MYCLRIDIILAEPDGSEITIVELVDYIPTRPVYEMYGERLPTNDCKYEVLFIIYKDKDNKKKIRAIPRPEIESV